MLEYKSSSLCIEVHYSASFIYILTCWKCDNLYKAENLYFFILSLSL